MKSKYKRVKTPTIIQMEAVECGAASLAMVLAYHKKYIPLERLRIECGVSRDGVKAGNIARAAERLGLSVKAFRKEPNQLADLQPPMIIHWNFNHFVVFEGFHKDKAYINDPALGHTVLTMSEFDKAFTGVVLTFEPKDDFLPDGEKPSVISSLKKRLSGLKSTVPFMGFVGLLLVIPSLIIPSFAKIFIDDILTNEHTEYLSGLLAAMALTMLLQAFLMFIQKKYLLLVKTKMTVTETSKFFVHILKLPIVFFQQRSAGDINSRMNSNNTITAFLTDKLAENFINILMIIFYIAAMISFSPTLTVISIILVAANIVYFIYASERVKEISNKSMNDSGKLYSTAVSGINIIETIKATGSESDFFSKWSGYHAKVLNNSQLIGKKRQYLFSIPNFISALANVLMITIGSIQIINGTGNMSVGTLIAFQSLFASFTAPVTSITQMGMEIRDFQADMNRIDDVMKYETDSDFGNFEAIENNKSVSFIQGNVLVKEISFGYNILEPPLIDNFSINLSSGQRVAIIGGSGSGKSTVLKIIAGLHKQWAGEILFDGIKNSDLSPQTFSRFITMVNQDINIFEGTIHDNITMWNDSIPEVDVIQAAKDAEIYDDISKRPNGFKEIMTDGGRNFSGGQCQRIEIARALAVNPSILLMDEATSALDAATEKRVFDNIRRRGCTCIIVAHRLSTIRDCDEIIVMKKGCIAQRGTHDEMKNQDGIYSQLILADS